MKHSAHNSVQPEFNTIEKYEACFNEEQKYIWDKMIRIEKLKKEISARKKLLLQYKARKN